MTGYRLDVLIGYDLLYGFSMGNRYPVFWTLYGGSSEGFFYWFNFNYKLFSWIALILTESNMSVIDN
jgi:hypothetical protein